MNPITAKSVLLDEMDICIWETLLPGRNSVAAKSYGAKHGVLGFHPAQKWKGTQCNP